MNCQGRQGRQEELEWNRRYNQFMATRFKELEKQARALSAGEKSALARVLIEDLDPATDPNIEQLWIEEAQRRYDAFTDGKLKALPGEEVMRRARRRLK